jgi:ABC-type multidrug transport system ATPase subunit
LLRADRLGFVGLRLTAACCAGKTSLIDIISGRRYGPDVRGSLHVDGAPITNKEMRRISGYVYQDDILPGTSTVWEYMVFHHSLRVASARSQRQQNTDIWGVLDQLGLAKVAHSPIGDYFTRGLSGGEKRRCVSCELSACCACVLVWYKHACMPCNGNSFMCPY